MYQVYQVYKFGARLFRRWLLRARIVASLDASLPCEAGQDNAGRTRQLESVISRTVADPRKLRCLLCVSAFPAKETCAKKHPDFLGGDWLVVLLLYVAIAWLTAMKRIAVHTSRIPQALWPRHIPRAITLSTAWYAYVADAADTADAADAADATAVYRWRFTTWPAWLPSRLSICRALRA